MTTLPRIYNDYTIEKYLKDLFTINYDDHKYSANHNRIITK